MIKKHYDFEIMFDEKDTIIGTIGNSLPICFDFAASFASRLSQLLQVGCQDHGGDHTVAQRRKGIVRGHQDLSEWLRTAAPVL